MAYKTYFRYHQVLDLYKNISSTNNAGQKYNNWSVYKEKIPCVLQPVSSERRVTPYIANIDEYEVLVPHSYASYFSYGYRIDGIKDRYNTAIVTGPFEIVEINRRTGWNGKLSHILVRIRLVVEAS
jgi:hypothetical protein